MAHLDDQLDRLRATLTPPPAAPSAALVGLMPCEPAIGPVAVAVWTTAADDETVELVRLDDGARVDDSVALRESFTLLAMVETVEELASFELLPGIAAELAAWDGDGTGLPETYVTARDAALAALDALAGTGPGEGARVAQPQLLDAMGAALRELERTWELLEQAAELWSDAYLASHENAPAAVEVVQGLWQMLATCRRGPLARPASSALHAGREAGAALAAAVAESARESSAPG